jgi:hypothetical protein
MRRQYAGGAKPTTLVSALGGSNSDLVVSGTDFTNYPNGSIGPFYIVIDRGQVSEEKILCSSRSGNTINVYNVGLTNGRGADGTTVVAHSNGATVEHVFTAVDADEANSHVNNTTFAHGLTIANVVTTTGTQILTNKTLISVTGNQDLASYRVRNSYASTDAPTAGTGSDGDLWIQYEA